MPFPQDLFTKNMFSSPVSATQHRTTFLEAQNSILSFKMQSEQWMEPTLIAAHQLQIDILHVIGKAASLRIALLVFHSPCDFSTS